MKSILVLVMGFVLVGSAARADSQLSPLSKVEPGLWEQKQTTLVNGQDIMAQMMGSHGAMMQNMSPEAKKKMIDQFHAPQKHCIKPEDLKNIHEAFFKKNLSTQPDCKTDVLKSDSHSVKFSISCDKPGRYTSKGEVNVDVESSKSFKFKYTNHATYQVPNQPPRESAMESTGTAQWVSADCGSVKF